MAAGMTVNGFEYRHNRAHQRTRMKLADGSYWLYQFDALGQVVSGRRYWGDGTPVAGEQFEYAFDDIGNRENTGGRASAASSYSVDRRNQYGSRTVAAYADVLGIANPTANVTVNGNTAARKGEYFHHALSVPNGSAAYPAVTVVSAYGSGQSTTGHVFVAASPEAFAHDADGNLTQDGRWAYTWDGENRLTQMLRNTDSPLGARQRLSFQYDHQGRRIMKAFCVWTNSAWSVVSSNKFLYDGWNVVAELNATNNALIRSYTWGTDLSGSVQGAGGVGGLLHVGYHVGTVTNGFVAYDGNGNVAGLVRASDGTTVARYDYGPFAEALRATGPMAAANPMRFSTKYQDGESGFLYYGYRYYNPSTGRWLNRDPISERGGLNIHGFVGNAPNCHFDLLGRNILDPITKTTWAEKMWWCRHQDCQKAARQVRNEVVSAVMAEFTTRHAHDDGTEVNAILHCTWMCATASLPQCGSEAARELGDAHEKWRRNPEKDRTMDLYNNSMGLSLAEPGNAAVDCLNVCKLKAKDRLLIWHKATPGDPTSSPNWPLWTTQGSSE